MASAIASRARQALVLPNVRLFSRAFNSSIRARFPWRTGITGCGSVEAVFPQQLVNHRQYRWFSDIDDREWTDIQLPELKTLLADRSITLIDVREPVELAQTGKIGDAVNIPLGQILGNALHLDENAFFDQYKAKKPNRDDAIVFSCLAGVRSRKAMNRAHELGYKNARHYVGGWQEWSNVVLGTGKKE